MDERFTDAEVREFIGYLSGAVPELHHVEVPRLAEAWEQFKQTRGTGFAQNGEG